jgi:O-methyltransferase
MLPLKPLLFCLAGWIASRIGYELHKRGGEPEVPPGMKLVPRELCPNGHKLISPRQEPGFKELAERIVADGRTFLGFDRLFVLWQAVENTRGITGVVAEVGTYRGGSARFLSEAVRAQGEGRGVDVFDTFDGHPDTIDAALDGPHRPGLFSDTSYESVCGYLGPDVRVHRGAFRDTCGDVADACFSLVHVDVDIYDSTVACLEFFWPRLQPKGVMVIDDYGFTTCRGLKVAVDSFIRKTPGCHRWYMHTGQLVLRKWEDAKPGN